VVIIRKIREHGITLILIEHHMDVVMSVCDVRHRARLRPEDRGRNTGGRAGESAGDQGLPRRRARCRRRRPRRPLIRPQDNTCSRSPTCTPATAKVEVLQGHLAGGAQGPGRHADRLQRRRPRTTTMRAISGMIAPARRQGSCSATVDITGRESHRIARPGPRATRPRAGAWFATMSVNDKPAAGRVPAASRGAPREGRHRRRRRGVRWSTSRA